MRRINEPDSRTKHGFLSFLPFAAFFQAVGGSIGWLTGQGVDGWYQTLRKSPLTPPDSVFGIVWSALYLLLAISFWLVWKSPHTPERRYLLILFAAHMLLNWLWSPLFFIAHATGASVLLIFAMIFTAAILAWLVWPIDKRASLIFAPYITWLIFAGHLSHYIWQSN